MAKTLESKVTVVLVFTGSYQSNSNVALLSGPVVYSVLLFLLVTLWQNI